jgi:hypothetical protein
MLTLAIVAAVVLFLAAIVLVLALCRSAAIGDRDLPHPPDPSTRLLARERARRRRPGVVAGGQREGVPAA